MRYSEHFCEEKGHAGKPRVAQGKAMAMRRYTPDDGRGKQASVRELNAY